MLRSELMFDRPRELQAAEPAEVRGMARDEVRLMVTTPGGHIHTHFHRLAEFLEPGDLLVVNRSATLAASLPAIGAPGEFRLNFATNYGHNLWLAEPRWSYRDPGPLPLAPGETIAVAGAVGQMVAPYPGAPRLWFIQFDQDVQSILQQHGVPIRYGYVSRAFPLAAYQTLFSLFPGSAEMPSAARPFTRRVCAKLQVHGVKLAGITLHTGVSSLEVESDTLEKHPMPPEPFWVPQRTADAVNQARSSGRRVIAVGTTVVRALESAWNGKEAQRSQGFTRVVIQPDRGVRVVDGLISGFHDPFASHLAMLYAIAGAETIRSAYAEAVEQGYLWHEFGDSHLLLPPRRTQ